MYGVIMSFREREEWGAVVTSCFAEYGMMTMDVGDVADRRTFFFLKPSLIGPAYLHSNIHI